MNSFRKFGSLLARFVVEKPFQKLRRLSVEKPESWGMPWSFKGVPANESYIRYLPDRLFIQNNISAPALLTTLYQEYEKVIQAFANSDLESVQDLVEPNLRAKLERMLEGLKESNRRLELVNDKKAFKEDRPTVNFSDGMIFRGLSTQREKNDFFSNYHVFTDNFVGVCCFTHIDVQNPFAYIDQAKLEELFKLNRQSLMQLLLWVKSPWKLNVYEGDTLVSKYDSEYNWAQEVAFECMLEQPPWMTEEHKNETYLEWIAKFKLGPWRMFELNGVLDGNALVSH
mmetsp:Transcript_4891/g.9158  ORF Transcript_4891/g.9158 Transcript_4891/m.9158 type:complete len:284 (-) Transcript_4891:641-1492(-)